MAVILPDWIKIEAEYRAGIKTLRQIGEEQGISHVAIARRAKKQEWIRDLAPRIKARADMLVTKAIETRGVTKKARLVTEADVVEANAINQADIQIREREDVRRSRELVMRLMEEAEGMTGAKDLLEELGEFMRSEDDKGQDRRNDLYRKIISFPGRVDGVKKLVESLRIMVELERKVNGIRDLPEADPNATGTGDTYLDTLNEGMRRLGLPEIRVTQIG